MSHFTKLFCRNLPAYLHGVYYSSIKKAGGKWAEMLDVREKDYFTKKDQEYLSYIKSQLKQGKNIQQIMDEYKKQFMDKSEAELKRAKAKAESHAAQLEEDLKYVLTKNKMFMEHVKAELQKGRQFEDIIKEAKKIIKETKRKLSQKKK